MKIGFRKTQELFRRSSIRSAEQKTMNGVKLKGGRVSFAIESIKPTRISLLNKINNEDKALRKSFPEVNGVSKLNVLCTIQYGEITLGVSNPSRDESNPPLLGGI